MNSLCVWRTRPEQEPELHSFMFEGHRLAYEVHGTGERTVVLVHGMLLDANLNRGLARSLATHGNRVVLLDLLGHGRSDKPRHAAPHRMDLYARQMVALLDELNIERAVLGGVSLGADVSLQAAVLAPERVQGLILEMPVLEWAVPAAAALFVPLLLAAHYARPLLQGLSWAAGRVPRTGMGPLDSMLNMLSLDPDEAAAVLHGVLLGPIAPPVEDRERITAPTLVLGHRADLIHPFSDAANLARQLPNAVLVSAHSPAELRVRPKRLTAELVRFLDRVWEVPGAPTNARSHRKAS